MRLELHVLTDVMTNTMLSLKQPGEEYSAVKNKLQSTVLGREEVKDITRLAVKDNERGAGFQLPEFSNETMAEIFAETPEVGVQVKCGSERFHMTSRQLCWCSKVMKRRPFWFLKQVPWELNSLLMWMLSFFPINLHRC